MTRDKTMPTPKPQGAGEAIVNTMVWWREEQTLLPSFPFWGTKLATGHYAAILWFYETAQEIAY